MLFPRNIVNTAAQFGLLDDLTVLCNASAQQLNYYTQTLVDEDGVSGYRLTQCSFEDADVITANIEAVSGFHSFDERLPADVIDMQRIETMFGLSVDVRTYLGGEDMSEIKQILAGEEITPVDDDGDDVYVAWRHRDLDRKIMISHPDVYKLVVSAEGVNLAEIDRLGKGETAMLNLADIAYLKKYHLHDICSIQEHMSEMVKALSMWASCASVFIDKQQ